ncbi:hypothetical protein Tco_1531682 [Tanacetum coccineum]
MARSAPKCEKTVQASYSRIRSGSEAFLPFFFQNLVSVTRGWGFRPMRDKEEEQELHRQDSLQVEGRIGALGKLFPLYQKEDGRGDQNSGLRASTTIGYLTLGESGREGAASRRRHPLRFAKESCGAVKGSRWGSRLSWSPPTCGRGGELILRCQGARRRPQVEATDALVIPVDSLLPVRACCHAGKSGAFGLFLISKVARGRKMRIQSRRSGRMVEESMDSLGIDSRWLDIRVTTGREEERSTTELLATSCKGKDKTTFRTFLLVQTFE